MATAMGDVAVRCFASKTGGVVVFFAMAQHYTHSGKLLARGQGSPKSEWWGTVGELSQVT